MQEAVTSRTKPSLMKLVAKKVKEKESLGLYESSVDIENAVNIDYGANPHWKRGHRCWEAKGEAAQQYKSMESSLLNELNQSRKESFCEVCISLFMIGKSPRHAKPIILISSEDKRSRQEAKAALDSSGILEDTGFKIGVLKYLPSGPIHPVASIRDGSLDGTALYRSPSSSSSSEPTPSALSSNFAYYNLNRDLQAIGMPIYVKTDENVVRMATANLLYNGKGYGYMTAAHIFDGWTKASSNKDDGEGDLVDGIPFDSDSDTDGDFYDEEYIPTPQNLRSTKAVSSKPQASRVHGTWLGKSQGASSETFLVDDEARSELVVLGRVSTSQKDLDFAIITVNDSKLEKQLDNLTSSGDRQHDRLSATKPFPSKVTAFTTHGPVDGASFHVPTLIRLPGSDRYRSLYGFTYEGSIEVGDCGSLVFSKDSRSLYGMIIAASDKEPIAYVVAGDQIVQSIAEVGQWRPATGSTTSQIPAAAQSYDSRLDTRYRRVAQPSRAAFFVSGRVFKMLWTEPAGQINPGKTRNSTHFSTVQYGETAFSEIRRFVVVRNKGDFSQCIPIQTYRGRGAAKPGLRMSDHGIIHTTTTTPNQLPGEALTKYSIQVQSTEGEYLEVESRVNYGKAYVVEHNVKVLDVGMVVEGHRYLLKEYFDAAMQAQ
ncbi:unnamed protein product [Alternaria alternata]